MTVRISVKALVIILLCVYAQRAPSQIFELPAQETWRLTLIGETGGFLDLAAASIDVGGNVFLADRESNMIYKIGRDGFMGESIGGFGWGNTEFDRPSGIWAENGIDIYITDYGNHRVQRFDRRLSYVGTLETRRTGYEAERFGYPSALTLNRQGDLFVADEENLRIIVFGSFDRFRRTFGGLDAGRFRVGSPEKIETFGDDLIAVRDGDRLLFFDQFGSPFREYSKNFLGDYKDFSIDGEMIFLLRDDYIDVYRGNLHHPSQKIRLHHYISEPEELTRIAVMRNRLVLMSRDTVWLFMLLR